MSETRILEWLDDFRPLAEQVKAAQPGSALLARYAGTELVQCWANDATCTVAVIASGPLDIGLTLELVGEGWVYHRGKHFCPAHRSVMLS